MKMILEGSNSAETFSPWGGGAGLRLLSLWEQRGGWLCRLFFEGDWDLHATHRWPWYLLIFMLRDILWRFFSSSQILCVFEIWVNCSGYYTQYTYLRYRRRLWLTHLCLLLDTLEPHTYMLYSQRVVAIQSSTKLLSLQLNDILLRVLLIPCRNAQILRPHPRWASRLGAFLFNCFLSNYSPFRLCVVEFPC